MLTKAQVVTKLAQKAALPKRPVAALLAERGTFAAKETRTTGAFGLPGIGKAVKVARKARVGRNPKTGEALKIPARTVVRFRMAKAFKDAVVPPKKK